MLITITIISILAVSVVVWLANKFLMFTICPICAGVFLTWVGLLGAYNFGYQVDLTIPALLMGGTVVGVAYQLEKKFKNLFPNRILFWKVLFIPVGFVAMYGILEQLWTMFLVAIAFLLLITLTQLRKTENGNGVKSELEKKMEESCC